MWVIIMAQILQNLADTKCNITGAPAKPGASFDAGYRVSWFLGYGLSTSSDPMKIVCTNTTTT
jgi:hypothetical protein